MQITASREEIFSAYRHAQPLMLEIKTGVKKDGTLARLSRKWFGDDYTR